MIVKASEIEKAVEEQCAGFYPMSLVGAAAKAVERCVNQGIDSHLEVCFDDKVDSYNWERGTVVRLTCLVSGSSLAVLLRRLTEDEGPKDRSELDGDEDEWEGPMLASDILETLGWKEVDTGCVEIMSRVDEEAEGKEEEGGTPP